MTNCLRIINSEEYDKLQKLKSVLAEKETQLQSMNKDIADLIKENKALQQTLEKQKQAIAASATAASVP